MKFEYVVSGLTMGIDDLYYNEEVAKPYINHMNQKIRELDKRFDNQNLSILYNAHQERRHGVTMTETMSDSCTEYLLTQVVFKWQEQKKVLHLN